MSRDVHELLRSTADAPTRALDTAAVVRRAGRPSRLLRAVAGAGALVAVAAGVASLWPPGEMVPTITAEPGRSADVEALVGRTFASVAVTEDGQPRELLPDTELRISLRQPSSWRTTDPDTGERRPVAADAVATWSGGCNAARAPIAVADGHLALAPGPPGWARAGGYVRTHMLCSSERDDQQAWFSAVISDLPQWILEGDRLTLETDSVTIVLEERPDQYWQRDER